MSKKWQKRLLWIGGFILVIIILGLFLIKTVTYTPTTQAQSIADKAEKESNTLIFKGQEKNPTLIFYQGALVENESYSIWAQKVAAAGYSVYLVKEPLNLAVFAPNKAEKIIKKYKLNSYIVGGHSLGGVMASRFAASEEENSALKGVFFLGSYPDEKGQLTEFEGSVLSLTASNDGVLNWKAYQEAKKYLPKQTIYEEIAGGNHAGFGSYGKQKGDKEATINNDEQQDEVAQALIRWLDGISK